MRTLSYRRASHTAMFPDPGDREQTGYRNPTAPKSGLIRDRASHNDRYTSHTVDSRFASGEKIRLRSDVSETNGGYGHTGYRTRESSVAPRNGYADEDDRRSVRHISHYALIDHDEVPVAENPRDMFELDPTDPSGYRDLLVHECATKVAQNTHGFRQLSYRCADLKIDVRPVPISQDITLPLCVHTLTQNPEP